MSQVCSYADCMKDYNKYYKMNILKRLGPVLLSTKPMHVFCFPDHMKFKPQLMETLGQLVNQREDLALDIVYSYNNTTKMIIYNLNNVNNLLKDRRVQTFLNNYTPMGYSQNYRIYADYLNLHLEKNIVPSELGVFFGYPVKDVMGFMGHPKLKHTKTLGWKMYGDSRISEEIFKAYKNSEEQISIMADQGYYLAS